MARRDIRERTATMVSWIEASPVSKLEMPFVQAYGLTLEEFRKIRLDIFVELVAPHVGRPKTRPPRRGNRGRPPTYDSKFVEEVNAWRQTLLLSSQGQARPPASGLAVRTHSISPRLSREVTTKLAVEQYLRALTGRDPSAAQVKRIAVRYCQLAGRYRNARN